MAEVHDCFTPTELVLMEDLGFAERGEGWKEVLAGTFDLHGDLPVNTDGGLKSFGHPVGASGLRMIFEGWLQLRGEAPEERPIDQRPHAGAHPQPGRLPRRDGQLRRHLRLRTGRLNPHVDTAYREKREPGRRSDDRAPDVRVVRGLHSGAVAPQDRCYLRGTCWAASLVKFLASAAYRLRPPFVASVSGVTLKTVDSRCGLRAAGAP